MKESKISRRELLKEGGSAMAVVGGILLSGGSWDLLRRGGIPIGETIVSEKQVEKLNADAEQFGFGWGRIKKKGEVKEAKLDIKAAVVGTALLIPGVIFSKIKTKDHSES